MPRGRIGLVMIPAADVRAAIARHGHSVLQAAVAFRVADRTVRRWESTGLPINYGDTNVTQDEWNRYVSTGSSGRTGVDRQLSNVVEAAAEPRAARRRAQPAPARREPRPPKITAKSVAAARRADPDGRVAASRIRAMRKKRLRTSRELLAAYRKLHS